MSDQEIQRKKSARLTFPGVAMLFGLHGELLTVPARMKRRKQFEELVKEHREGTALAVLAVRRRDEIDPAPALRKICPGKPSTESAKTVDVAIDSDRSWARGAITALEHHGKGPQIALLAWNVDHDGAMALSLHVRTELKDSAPEQPTVTALVERFKTIRPNTQLELDLIRGELERWERRFRYGESLTEGQHERLEKTMARLERLKASARQDKDSKQAADYTSLVDRFYRLLDGQASRDATGALERVVSVLASLVLVPGLVAGVYGANVSVPLNDSEAGWRAMLGLMALGAAVTYIGLSAIRPSAVTRNISVHVAGSPRLRDDQDLSWLPRPILCALAGGAVGTALNALVMVPNHDIVHDAPSTAYALIGGQVAVVLAAAVIATADMIERSPIHAFLDVVVVIATGGLLYSFLHQKLGPTLVCLGVLIALAVVFFGWSRVREVLCEQVRRRDVA